MTNDARTTEPVAVWACPFCGQELANEQVPCCGEAGCARLQEQADRDLQQAASQMKVWDSFLNQLIGERK